jgi:hypothetical protein
VTSIFWDTFVLGSPIPFRIGCRDVYEQLALSWYQEHPEQSRVAVIDGKVVGYVLVCTDQAAFEAAQYRNGLNYLRHVLPRLIGPISRLERKFILTRLLDGFEAWRDEDPMAVGAHAHFNLKRGFRSGRVVRGYVEHIDVMCADAGLTHWTGQINAKDGRRVRLLEEYGFNLASTTPNRTLSWLARSEVRRVTVVREAGSLERLSAAS